MNKTITLAQLMRQMGVQFDINPFVNAYIQRDRKKAPKRKQKMPALAMLSRRP